MANITLSVDEKTLAAVRRYAAEQDSSVNALVRSYLTNLALHEDRATRARARLGELSSQSGGQLGQKSGHATIFMTARVFLDTNVLVYAAIGFGKDEPKRNRALALIQDEDFATSAQVVQEFFVTVVRKAARPLSTEQVIEWIQQLIVFPCQAIDLRLVRIAIEQSARYRISYWDAAVLSAARALGCAALYSEDLNDGQQYEGLKVVNPFKTRAAH